MFYFTIYIYHAMTRKTLSKDVCFNSFTTKYFEAWKKAVDAAKDFIDEQAIDDAPNYWAVEKICDCTAR